MQATSTTAKKYRPRFSYLVAIVRKSFSRFMVLSTGEDLVLH